MTQSSPDSDSLLPPGHSGGTKPAAAAPQLRPLPVVR